MVVPLLQTENQRAIVQETAVLAESAGTGFHLHGMLHDKGQSHAAEFMLQDSVANYSRHCELNLSSCCRR